jgi:hypothetical protein
MVVGLCAFALMHTALASGISACHIGSSDPYGADKNTFSQHEDVYATGSGFTPNTVVDIWVVNRTTWTDGMPIPSNGIVTKNVPVNGAGNIIPTVIWHQLLTPGTYDIVVDANRNGVYNQAVDCLDAGGCNVVAGFFVIPELLLGTALGLAAFFAALGVYRYSKRHPGPKQPFSLS